MWRRYQNEGMIAIALLLLLCAVLFKSYRYNTLQASSKEASQMASRIEDIATMKKLWNKNKTIPEKLESLKRYVGGTKIKQFEVKKKKAHIVLQSLNGSQLNSVTGKYLASIPVQIIQMNIQRDGDNYGLELRCKW